MGDRRRNLKVNINCGSVQKMMNVWLWHKLQSHEVFMGCDTVFFVQVVWGILKAVWFGEKSPHPGAQHCVLAVTLLWAYHFPQVWGHVLTWHFLEFISSEHANWTHMYVVLHITSDNRNKVVTNGCGYRRYNYNFSFFHIWDSYFQNHACRILTNIDFWLLTLKDIH